MTGWTWDQVRDQLDLPRVDLLHEQWAQNPPLPLTMRAAAEALGVEFNGSKPLGEGPKSLSDASTFDPMAVMDEIGLAEGDIYVRPAAGMPFAQV